MTTAKAASTMRGALPFDSSVVAPVRALLAAPEDAVLAIISAIEGPSYRPLGAMMTVLSNKDRVGSLSSGCIEADIALQACTAREAGIPRKILYGRGSPFIDIQLPCGGGLEILLLPSPDRAVLSELLEKHDAREPCTLDVNLNDGAMTFGDHARTVRHDNSLSIRVEPEIFFYVFGKGPEASTFAALVQSAGYPNLLLSPDRETLEIAGNSGCPTRHLTSAHYPADLDTDSRTAVTLFFHDHDWEPPILAAALRTSAFYIGAQGSRNAAEQRIAELGKMGVDSGSIDRLRGPVGLVPSAKDARTLAVSVLAEVLSVAMLTGSRTTVC